jgi:DNA-nicking Smr family endonuclease
MAAHHPHGHRAPTPAEEAIENAFLAAQRAPAEQLWAQRAEQSAASQRLYAAQDKAGAKAASEAAHALEGQAKAADAAAAQAIFAHKQQRMTPAEIDLHGLRVEEAKSFLGARLEAEGRAKSPFLVVIYGQGHHSADHKQHIKPAVLDMMRARGLAVREGWHEAQGCANEGVCTVSLGGAGGAAAARGWHAKEPAPPPGFDAGLRIKLPQERSYREAAHPPPPAEPAGGCCTIM